MYFLLVFFFFVSSVSTQGELACYECNPQSLRKCEFPDSTFPVINCLDDNTTKSEMKFIPSMVKNSTEPPLCYSLYLEAGRENTTGYYRGCSNQQGLEEFCKDLQRVMQDAKMTMVGCTQCNKTRCNDARFKVETTEQAPTTVSNKKVRTGHSNGAEGLSVGLFVVTAGLYLCNL